MKKLLCALAFMACATLSAAAADVGTIRNDYPGDTEAQAQMLHELGLFNGTEKGFELEKPMTRAEAAAMLTRFLGAEQTARAGTWEHPFTDVPQWAAPYVGWLYENGLTKGVSATRYGAAESVTCAQYCVFLSRALKRNYDAYLADTYYQEAIEVCDSVGFVRGDAVAVSANVLGWLPAKDSSDNVFSLAQNLIRRGVFTKEQLIQAAEGVLPYGYAWVGADGGVASEDKALSKMLAGVPVLRCQDTAMHELPQELRKEGAVYHLYGVKPGEAAGTESLCVVDPESMEATAVAQYAKDEARIFLGGSTGADYWQLGKRVLCVRGVFAEDTGIQMDALEEAEPQAYLGANNMIAFDCANGLAVIGAEGANVLPTESGESLFLLWEGYLITEQSDGENTLVRCRAANGDVRNCYTVAFQGTESDPLFRGHTAACLWGGAGLYRLQVGGMQQLTARAVYGFAQDQTDNSFVLITHDAGKRVEYIEYAVPMSTGDTLIRLRADGTEEALLPALPDGSLLLGEVTGAEKGKVTFTTLKASEPHYMSRFTCVLENGRIRVTDADFAITMIWGENAIAEEQARLDALGVGGNAA